MVVVLAVTLLDDAVHHALDPRTSSTADQRVGASAASSRS